MNNTASFHHLAEIWQFPPGESGGGLGLRRPQFGNGFGDFASGPTRDEPIGSEQRTANHCRKRRDSEEEPVKGVSTSNGGANGNGVVSAHSMI